METLLLSEKGERWRPIQIEPVGGIVKPIEGEDLRRTTLHDAPDETISITCRSRSVKPREYRHWGINE